MEHGVVPPQRQPRGRPGMGEVVALHVQHRAAGADGAFRPQQDIRLHPFGVHLDQVHPAVVAASPSVHRLAGGGGGRGPQLVQPKHGHFRRAGCPAGGDAIREPQAHHAEVLPTLPGDARHMGRARPAARSGAQRRDDFAQPVGGNGAQQQLEQLHLGFQRRHAPPRSHHAGKGHGVGARVGSHVQHMAAAGHVGGQCVQFRLRPLAVLHERSAYGHVEVKVVEQPIPAGEKAHPLFQPRRQRPGRGRIRSRDAGGRGVGVPGGRHAGRSLRAGCVAACSTGRWASDGAGRSVRYAASAMPLAASSREFTSMPCARPMGTAS